MFVTSERAQLKDHICQLWADVGVTPKVHHDSHKEVENSLCGKHRKEQSKDSYREKLWYLHRQ